MEIICNLLGIMVSLNLGNIYIMYSKGASFMDLNIVFEQLSIDRKEVIQRFANNEGLYQKFLIKFRDEDGTFDQLTKAVESDDYKEVEMAAHTLKGISGNLGLKSLMNYSSDLVDNIRNSQKNIQREKVNELYVKVDEEYKKIITCLNQF